MEGSLSHLSVLFLRFRCDGAARVAAGALADSVMDDDLLVDVVDVHDHRCGSRPQGGVVGGCLVQLAEQWRWLSIEPRVVKYCDGQVAHLVVCLVFGSVVQEDRASHTRLPCRSSSARAHL